MGKLLHQRRFLALDLALLPIAAYCAFVLRLERIDITPYWTGLFLVVGIVLIVTPLCFYLAGVYARYWRYASVAEFLLLAGALFCSVLLLEVAVLSANQAATTRVVVPNSIPAIFLLLALSLTASVRLLPRLRTQRRSARRIQRQQPSVRVLVMGAGDAGETIVRDLRTRSPQSYQVVGFVDDDPLKRNIRIHGVEVLGDRHDLPRLVAEHAVGEVIIAMPSVAGKTIRELVAICERAGVRAKSMPGLSELIDGTVNFSMVRDVQIEDLLRRAPVATDFSAVSQLLCGRRVLVTGGGGSIGSELCRQVLRCQPAELIILGHGENSVFTIYNELRRLLADRPEAPQLHTVIADIRFPEQLGAICAQYRPEIVFHAAAHKHVPLMEINPSEAIANNVIGTRNLLDAARAADVAHFVMISTDKAVHPTSVMGSTKRAAELLVYRAALLSGKPYATVRFGNVLGSRGSVVLTFQQQIAAGGPVTVTHPEMSRYFMTIPEAVQLVLQAAALSAGGEVFTLDMGEPVRIVDLARDMIELSGLEIGHDIDIIFSGTRPGEKLFEELFLPDEEYQRTRHEKIFIACNAGSFVPPDLIEQVSLLEIAARQQNHQRALMLLRQLIQGAEHATPQLIPAEPHAIVLGR